MRKLLSIALLLCLPLSAFAVSGTGGTVTNYTENGTNFRAHIFTGSGTYTSLVGGSVQLLVVGGLGGGGAGGNSSTVAGTSGTPNTGGGCGGHYSGGQARTGGSGIVIVRYVAGGGGGAGASYKQLPIWTFDGKQLSILQ